MRFTNETRHNEPKLGGKGPEAIHFLQTSQNPTRKDVDIRAALQERLHILKASDPSLIPQISGLEQKIAGIDKIDLPASVVRAQSLKDPGNIFLECNPIAPGDGLASLAYGLEDLRSKGAATRIFQAINTYLQENDEYSSLPLLKVFSAHEILRRAELEKPGSPDRFQEPLRKIDEILGFHNPCIIAVGGYSGSGKSTISRALADTGMIHLATDVLRKRLIPSTSPEPDAAYGIGVYGFDTRTMVYEEIRKRAEEVINTGYPAIIDGTFLNPAERQAVEKLAQDKGVPFIGFWCEAPQHILEERVRKRAAAKTDASDAGIKVLHGQLAENAGEIAWQKLDMMSQKEEIFCQVNTAVAQLGFNGKNPF